MDHYVRARDGDVRGPLATCESEKGLGILNHINMVYPATLTVVVPEKCPQG